MIYIFTKRGFCFVSELKKEKAKAERNGNLKEEADWCNCIGNLYANYGVFYILVSSSYLDIKLHLLTVKKVFVFLI